MCKTACLQHLFYGTEAETMPKTQPSLKARLAERYGPICLELPPAGEILRSFR